jgi:glutathione S-transferase
MPNVHAFRGTSMKLYLSTTSPFVRKVMASAIELGLADRIEKMPTKVSPVVRTSPVIAQNPIGKVPTLVTDEGDVLFDSRVICEYLDAEAGGGRIIPKAGKARWRALTDQALADAIQDAGLLARYESTLRPQPLHWQDWHAGQMDKVAKGLDRLEAAAAGLDGRVDIGTIAIGCCLGYLDFRYGNLEWRKTRPQLAAWAASFMARASMKDTVPFE